MKKVYLDNNANTPIPEYILNEMMKWYNIGNPGAATEEGKKSKMIIKRLKELIARSCNFSLSEYNVILTSGASESNATIIKSIVESWESKPHIITSSYEHKSVLYVVKDLVKLGMAEATYIDPDISGRITPESVENNIKDNTCLITIMGANNETGIVNDVRRIGLVAKKYKIPFHTDAVQLFSKYLVFPVLDNIDAFSISFHKVHGPIGVGALIIKKQLIKSYSLCPLICGTQNEGLRGGTENIVGIVGSYYGLLHNLKNRKEKNNYMGRLKQYLISELNKICPLSYLDDYLYMKMVESDSDYNNYVYNESCIVVLSPRDYSLPNTLLVSFKMSEDLKELCNKKLRELLAANNITVAIGSACNTSNKKASHVLDAIKVPQELKKGVLRISLGDENTIEEIKYFIMVIKKIIFKK